MFMRISVFESWKPKYHKRSDSSSSTESRTFISLTLQNLHAKYELSAKRSLRTASMQIKLDAAKHLRVFRSARCPPSASRWMWLTRQWLPWQDLIRGELRWDLADLIDHGAEKVIFGSLRFPSCPGDRLHCRKDMFSSFSLTLTFIEYWFLSPCVAHYSYFRIYHLKWNNCIYLFYYLQVL